MWLFGALDAVGQIIYGFAAAGVATQPAPHGLRLIAIGASVALTGWGAGAVRAQRASREQHLRVCAQTAVREVEKVSVNVGSLTNDDIVAELVRLSGMGEDMIRARITYLQEHPPESKLFIGPAAGTWTAGARAAQAVAYIVDLPPEWLYDCAESRRRQVGQPSTSTADRHGR